MATQLAVLITPHSPTFATLTHSLAPHSHHTRTTLALHAHHTRTTHSPFEFMIPPSTRTNSPFSTRSHDTSFASSGIDYLIINGGDGTVRDVLTCGHGVFGDDWPLLAVLPKGKTNALNVDLGAPADWSLRDAIDAFTSGTTVTRRPVEIAALDGQSAPLRGFILGAGAFTLGIRAGQDAHRYGFFDSFAVGMTAAWGVLQVVFGSDRNPWRRGVGMDLRLLPEGRSLPHSGHGDPARRELLLASTLRRMPLGIKLFGDLRVGLKLAVMDRPARRLMAYMPAILAGWQPRWLEQAGLHRRQADAFEMIIDDQFILDGEAFPAGSYLVSQGPELTFVTA